MARRTGAHQHQGKLHEASPDSSRFSQFKSLDRMQDAFQLDLRCATRIGIVRPLCPTPMIGDVFEARWSLIQSRMYGQYL